jgi:gluconolactonase
VGELPTLDFAAINFQQVAVVEPITSGFAILEGPVWYDGALRMSHIGGASSDGSPSVSDLVEWRDGQISVVESDYGSNGLMLDGNGELLAARQKDGTVTRVATGEILAGNYNGARFNSPNDLIVSNLGDIYFSDPDWQSPNPNPQDAERVYHINTDGNVTAFGSQITKPNGVMLSFDEAFLYVGGTNGLYKFNVNADGSIVGDGTRIQAGRIYSGVDGMSKDCAGNIYVVAQNTVFILEAETDNVLASYYLDGVTNVAFGGADGKAIFATTLGSQPKLHSATVNIPGFPF